MLIIFILVIVIFFLRILNYKRYNINNNKIKYKVYECRYNEMNYINMIYSSQFFILALSFILFDLEIVFFIPYFIIYYYSNYIVYILIFFFFFLLIRLYYELIQKIV